MAEQRVYALEPFTYGTRMLSAGQPVMMNGPDRRLYVHLGKVSLKKPKDAELVETKVKEQPPAPPSPPPAEAASEQTAETDVVPAVTTENAPAKPRRARRKKK